MYHFSCLIGQQCGISPTQIARDFGNYNLFMTAIFLDKNSITNEERKIVNGFIFGDHLVSCSQMAVLWG